MKIAIMQPYFLPYIGYFQLINAVDKFVFLDNVNFIKKGWINRNRLRIQEKEWLFSVPCKDLSQNKKICEIEVNWNTNFTEKFLKPSILSAPSRSLTKPTHSYSEKPRLTASTIA